MRWLLRSVVLVFAGLGVYKAWELVSPKLQQAQDAGSTARDTIAPAVRDAKDKVTSASADAVGTVIDATRDAAESVSDAVGEVVQESTPGTVAASPSPPS